MKRTLSFLLLLTGLWAGAQQHSESTMPAQKEDGILHLVETEFDFSKIPQGKPVFHYFEIKNLSKEPLKLDNVQATCGCTTPEWDREPIAPGATAKIKVGYNAAAEGAFEKYISIAYNTTQSKQIKIKGTVWKAPAGSAPANESVQFLKQQNL
jgi:hypothetical protein